jgi:hypothetical protein
MTVAVGTAPGDRVLAALDLWRLPPASLAEVNVVASLQTRVDRKYLVPAGLARSIVGDLAAGHHLQSVEGRASTSYASQYFDLPDWHCFRAHAQGRRRRWKVRTRLYTEDDLCRLELKTKDHRGLTVKHGLEQPPSAFGRITGVGLEFLDGTLAAAGFQVPVGALVPGVRIDYARATIVDLVGGTRLTIDGGLVASLGRGVVRIDRDVVLVETKGGVRPSLADTLLRRYGVRLASVSKYGVTLSMLEPSLPGAVWRRTARRHFSMDAPAGVGRPLVTRSAVRTRSVHTAGLGVTLP